MPYSSTHSSFRSKKKICSHVANTEVDVTSPLLLETSENKLFDDQAHHKPSECEMRPVVIKHENAAPEETREKPKTSSVFRPVIARDIPPAGANSCYGDLYADINLPLRTNSFASANSFVGSNAATDNIVSISIDTNLSSPMNRLFCLIDCENSDSQSRKNSSDWNTGQGACVSCLSKQSPHLLSADT